MLCLQPLQQPEHEDRALLTQSAVCSALVCATLLTPQACKCPAQPAAGRLTTPSSTNIVYRRERTPRPLSERSRSTPIACTPLVRTSALCPGLTCARAALTLAKCPLPSASSKILPSVPALLPHACVTPGCQCRLRPRTLDLGRMHACMTKGSFTLRPTHTVSALCRGNVLQQLSHCETHTWCRQCCPRPLP